MALVVQLLQVHNCDGLDKTTAGGSDERSKIKRVHGKHWVAAVDVKRWRAGGGEEQTHLNKAVVCEAVGNKERGADWAAVGVCPVLKKAVVVRVHLVCDAVIKGEHDNLRDVCHRKVAWGIHLADARAVWELQSHHC